MLVDDSTLLKGTWYAIEQAGHLLQHAAILHREKAYSSAAALGLIAREELGKYIILRDFWRDATGKGILPSVRHIRKACDEHVKKQRRAALSVSFTAEPPSRLDRILRDRFRLDPQSATYKAFDKSLGLILEKALNRLPEDRHNARMAALYVDPTESGTGWHLPKELSADEVTKWLADAVNDYAGQRDRLCPNLLKGIEPALDSALASWPDRPELPEPVWPNVE
ncbi:MAG: AbiV family abortive infection protein [Candidatus Acidiferrales bacterium]